MKTTRGEIATLGFENAKVYAVTVEYEVCKKAYTAVVIVDLEKKTANIVKDNGMPDGYKPEYIVKTAGHLLNVWKMDMLDSLCPFPVTVK